MSVAAGITGMGRRQAEALMTSTGTISRRNGTFTTHPTTLVETENMDLIYTGKCRVRITRSVIGVEGPIPGAVAVKDQLTLSIPVDAAGSGDVRPNDEWTCVTNPLDTSLVGVTLRIAGVHHGTYLTARRFPCEEIS